MNQKPLLNVQELSTALNVPVTWIYQQTSQKKIAFIKVGKYVRFDLDEVLQFLRTNPDASLSRSLSHPTITEIVRTEITDGSR